MFLKSTGIANADHPPQLLGIPWLREVKRWLHRKNQLDRSIDQISGTFYNMYVMSKSTLHVLTSSVRPGHKLQYTIRHISSSTVDDMSVSEFDTGPHRRSTFLESLIRNVWSYILVCMLPLSKMRWSERNWRTNSLQSRVPVIWRSDLLMIWRRKKPRSPNGSDGKTASPGHTKTPDIVYCLYSPMLDAIDGKALQPLKELVHRKLALVSLDYDAFCSPVPSSFVRIGQSCLREQPTEVTDWTNDENRQKTYTNQEYFAFTLLAPLGQGAFAVAHPAQAELISESGHVLRSILVFKMGFTEEHQQKLKREFEIYCLISRADGVQGIPKVYGLFQGFESSALGLLMDDGGQSLRQREIAQTGKYEEQVTISSEERYVSVHLTICHQASLPGLTVLSQASVFRCPGKSSQTKYLSSRSQSR